MDWSREPMQVLVKRFNRRGTITEYDLLSALDRNPTTINAGADICAEAKSTILAQADRIEELEAEAERMAQEAVAAALMEAAALAESAMRCRSCGGVFAVKNPHTDETCPKGRADWDNAEPDEVADAILALIPADALARLEARDARVREAAIRGLRGYLGNLTYDAARLDDYLAELTGGKDE